MVHMALRVPVLRQQEATRTLADLDAVPLQYCSSRYRWEYEVLPVVITVSLSQCPRRGVARTARGSWNSCLISVDVVAA